MLLITHITRTLSLIAIIIGFAGCGVFQPSPETPTPAQQPSNFPVPNSNTSLGIDTLGVVAYAAAMQGKPYLLGGSSPETGFDCSGLVQHVFGHFGLVLPRSADAIANHLPAVALIELQAADLVFFDTGPGAFSHVGIYLGDGRFVHAPSPRTGQVIISELANHYWHPRITAARRPQSLALVSARGE